MDFGFKGKVALVTGAGSQIGFGRETALLLAEEGCESIAVTDIDPDEARKTADAIKELGCGAVALKADITKKNEIDTMTGEVIKKYGKIDILCNVAGGILHKDNVPVDEQDDEIWEKQMKLNLFGTMLVTRSVLPNMRKNKYGAIVNVSSGSTHQYDMGVGTYAMSKASIDLFTKQLAVAEAKSGIRVNCVAPGPAITNFGKAIREKMPPLSEEQKKQMIETVSRSMLLGRLGTPRDIANAVVFLASDVSSYVTGHVFHVSGGSVM